MSPFESPSRGISPTRELKNVVFIRLECKFVTFLYRSSAARALNCDVLTILINIAFEILMDRMVKVSCYKNGKKKRNAATEILLHYQAAVCDNHLRVRPVESSFCHNSSLISDQLGHPEIR